MPLYLKSPDVAEMAARLAAARGVSKTEAVRQALRHELEREPAAAPRPRSAEDFVAIAHRHAERLRQMSEGPGMPADKAFIDSLYED